MNKAPTLDGGHRHMNALFGKASSVKDVYETQLLEKRNVFGCGIGYKEVENETSKTPSIILFVSKKLTLIHLKAKDVIPTSLQGVKTDVVELQSDKKWRQSGHVSPSYTARYDPICRLLAPICKFKCFQETKLKTLKEPRNLVDAAVGKVNDPRAVVPLIFGLGIPKGIREPQIGMRVLKSGRTTGVTRETIKATRVSLFVDYPGKGLALFEDQIATSCMSEPGDSGSLLVDDEHFAIGLLFGGTRGFSFFNRISNVFDKLKIEGIFTEGDPQAMKEVENRYSQGKKRTEDWRPIPGGVSIGRISQSSAGTLGCFVIVDDEICLLTNAHV